MYAKPPAFVVGIAIALAALLPVLGGGERPPEPVQEPVAALPARDAQMEPRLAEPSSGSEAPNVCGLMLRDLPPLMPAELSVAEGGAPFAETIGSLLTSEVCELVEEILDLLLCSEDERCFDLLAWLLERVREVLDRVEAVATPVERAAEQVGDLAGTASADQPLRLDEELPPAIAAPVAVVAPLDPGPDVPAVPEVNMAETGPEAESVADHAVALDEPAMMPEEFPAPPEALAAPVV